MGKGWKGRTAEGGNGLSFGGEKSASAGNAIFFNFGAHAPTAPLPIRATFGVQDGTDSMLFFVNFALIVTYCRPCVAKYHRNTALFDEFSTLEVRIPLLPLSAKFGTREWIHSALFHAIFHLHRHIPVPLRREKKTKLTKCWNWGPYILPFADRGQIWHESIPTVYAYMPNSIRIGLSCCPCEGQNLQIWPTFDINILW